MYALFHCIKNITNGNIHRPSANGWLFLLQKKKEKSTASDRKPTISAIYRKQCLKLTHYQNKILWPLLQVYIVQFNDASKSKIVHITAGAMNRKTYWRKDKQPSGTGLERVSITGGFMVP